MSNEYTQSHFFNNCKETIFLNCYNINKISRYWNLAWIFQFYLIDNLPNSVSYYYFEFTVQAIDADELEKILDSSNLLFTKQQVNDILKKIDTDQTNSLDFFECLKVWATS